MYFLFLITKVKNWVGIVVFFYKRKDEVGNSLAFL